MPPLRPWPYDPSFVNGVPSRSPSAGTTARRIPLIHILLFFLTLGTTTMAGAFQQGANPLTDFSSLWLGFPFAITLMSILLSHEMGHYLLARVHGVWASLPYFIPAPPQWFLVGTFGAFIRMRSSPANRRALFDVGAAGPWAGVFLAIPAVILGLSLSEIRPLSPLEGGIILGDSVLFSALTQLVLGISAEDVSVVLHPIALAGWFGLFVTCLNLLPVGQLDGGHVVYSLFGSSHRWIARIFLGVIFLCGFQYWFGWLIWVVLLLMLGIDHPPTLDRLSALDSRRKLYAWCTVGLFVLTFIPVPLSFSEPVALPAGETIPIAYGIEHSPVTQPLVFVYRP